MLRQQPQRNRNPDRRAIRARKKNRLKKLKKPRPRVLVGLEAVLDFSLRSREMDASAGAWNFGLCATRSREPRQARKGATVPGSPRVPQITRSSSHRTV